MPDLAVDKNYNIVGEDVFRYKLFERLNNLYNCEGGV